MPDRSANASSVLLVALVALTIVMCVLYWKRRPSRYLGLLATCLPHVIGYWVAQLTVHLATRPAASLAATPGGYDAVLLIMGIAGATVSVLTTWRQKLPMPMFLTQLALVAMTVAYYALIIRNPG